MCQQELKSWQSPEANLIISQSCQFLSGVSQTRSWEAAGTKFNLVCLYSKLLHLHPIDQWKGANPMTGILDLGISTLRLTYGGKQVASLFLLGVRYMEVQLREDILGHLYSLVHSRSTDCSWEPIHRGGAVPLESLPNLYMLKQSIVPTEGKICSHHKGRSINRQTLKFVDLV